MGGSRKKSKKKARSSSNSDSDDWVETATHKTSKSSEPKISQSLKTAGSEERRKDDGGDWDTVFSGVLSSRKLKETRKEDKSDLDKPGQHSRELNPYWKDGGSGIPQESPSGSRLGGVGDGGLQWLLRAKKRLEEQSKETGVSMEQLAVERWGSLSSLNRKITEAEDLSAFKSRKPSFKRPDQREEVYKKKRRRSATRSRSRSPRRRRRTVSKSDEEVSYSSARARKSPSKRDRRSRSRTPDKQRQRYRSKSPARYRKGSESRSPDRGRRRSRSGSREREEKRERNREENRGGRGEASNKSQSSSGEMKRVPSWKKKSLAPEVKDESAVGALSVASPVRQESETPSSHGFINDYLTDEEMNKLAAKILRAEMLGNQEVALEMKDKLERARKAKETVILTRTDTKGVTRPLERGEDVKGSTGRLKKVPTHEDKLRVRYFGDDDKYTLKEMFEREKSGTAEDQDAMFSRLAGKALEKTDDDYTLDDVFVSRAQREQNETRQAEKERVRAIKEHKEQTKVLEGCNRCLDNKETVKHLIIATGSKVCLSLPSHTPLTPGHCLIVPIHHIPSATQTDEDVWEEMQRFRRTLVRMFEEEDEDCIFFESAMNLKRWPHMVLECVPLPKEIGDLAPIYFKKAILDSETEWAQNKKLIDLRQRDVRRAVPKGLPYFSVDFGNQSGFAHVIEDEHLFPKNFAQEIIGGMLDLDHSVWRKPKREEFEIQMQRINEFTKKWEPFDFSKNND